MPACWRLPEPVLVKRRARQRFRESRAPAALVRSCGPRDPRCRPGRGSRRERQRPSSAGSSARPVAEPPPRDLFVRTDVALAGLGDHLGRHRWWRRSLVPARRLCPVAHRLLVERQRRGARVPGLGRPEPAGVRGEDLVADDQLAVDEPQLELGVRDHDAALERQLGRRAVSAKADLAGALGDIVTDELGRLLERDVLVVAFGRLRRRGEHRLGKACGLE